jgi:hypothetical protein
MSAEPGAECVRALTCCLSLAVQVREVEAAEAGRLEDAKCTVSPYKHSICTVHLEVERDGLLAEQQEAAERRRAEEASHFTNEFQTESVYTCCILLFNDTSAGMTRGFW